MYYVYVLICRDNSPYTGFTEDLRERFKRHINGHVPVTQNRPPVELIFYCAFQNKYRAFNFEKYLKSGSGRAFHEQKAYLNFTQINRSTEDSGVFKGMED